MPAKLVKKFPNENPDLEKQFGCVNAIFQMFDRHHFLTGRRPNDHKNKKLPSGHDLLKSGRHEPERNPCFSQILQEKNLSKFLYENEKASLESSRSSLSSSSSSSFSSIEFNKSSQQDACSFDRTFFPERSMKNSQKVKNSEDDANPIRFDPRNNTPVSKSHQQPSGFHNAVKDHMKKDSEILTIKTSSADKVKNRVVKHIDSPRPARITTPKMPSDLDEAIRVLIELKKAPWNFSEHGVKDASFYQESQRITPRFSMDSRDNTNSAAKLREIPRLSLDSKQVSQRSSNFASNTSLTLEDLDKIITSPCINRAANLLQDLGSERRHPGVVAKLMGLDEMPQLNSASREPATRRSSIPLSATSPKGIKDASSDRSPHSIQRRDSVMGKPKDHNSVQKTKSEFIYEEVEERLKKHQFQQQNKDLKALKQMVDAMRAKRLAQTTKDADQSYKVSMLEDYTDRTPKGSNHILRSPKVSKQPANSPKSLHSPIVIMKPAKSINISELEITKGMQATCNQSLRSPKACKQPANDPKSFGSPIVIMKPAKNVDISDASNHTVMQLEGLSTLPKLHTDSGGRKKGPTNITSDKVHSLRVRLGESKTETVLATDKQFSRRSLANNNSPRYHSNASQSLSKMQQGMGENTGVSTRTSTTLSPRLQQRKVEVEKQSYSPIRDLNKVQIQITDKKQVESISPRGRPRLKQSQMQKCSDQVDEYLPASYRNSSLASRSTVLQQNIRGPSSRTAQNAACLFNQENTMVNMNPYPWEKELASIDFEHPNPVPVLNDSCYQDEFTHYCLERRTSNTTRDHSPCTFGICCYQNGLHDGQVSDKKLQHAESLEHKLSSTNEELQNINFISSNCCDIQNPDHKYVSEILMTLGLLNKECDNNPFQIHSPFPVINPDLFGVLEKRQGETLQHKRIVEKNHRKLVFDVVNEILVHKGESISQGNCHEILLQKRKKIAGQHLLEEVCCEIKQLQAGCTRSISLEDDAEFIFREDFLGQCEGWEDFSMDKTKVGLQIERLILKDLINEVVGEVTEVGAQATHFD
ncbi:protein LONGIFOLIA 1-like [Canna indica]|uniref:Protein LONGIFOLIA 1-like n=1 Tax=Canna indica TaxID=4628 RepID=A0AAQ3QRD2_9LILI|nr:protein LONGIFOLIA 1-like [Canna indica]